MNVTVDANILFSALLRDGDTRKLWFNSELVLFAPRHLFVELSKYEKDFQKRTGLLEDDFKRILSLLLSVVKFIPDDELHPFLSAAQSLISDPKDVAYLACALKEDTIIWSNDKGFKEQSRIKVKNTTEMLEEFGRL